MKHFPVAAIGVFFIMCLACRKSTGNDDNEPPLSDSKTFVLKEVEVDRLPSPYFRLTYNDSNFVTHIDFADGLLSWKVEYENNRVIRLINNTFVNHDTLLYTYSHNKVVTIRHTNANTGSPLWRYDFLYDRDVLKEIRWWRFQSGPDSVLYRKVALQYYADGNLQQYDDYNTDNNNGPVTLTTTVKFSNYDQGVNVDDFYLLKNFFDDVLFLPQVKLQKNNPGHETITGGAEDYVIDYTYQYNTDKLPVQKDYSLAITRGANAGQTYTFTDHFTY